MVVVSFAEEAFFRFDGPQEKSGFVAHIAFGSIEPKDHSADASFFICSMPIGSSTIFMKAWRSAYSGTRWAEERNQPWG
jgi:hypothetical protein